MEMLDDMIAIVTARQTGGQEDRKLIRLGLLLLARLVLLGPRLVVGYEEEGWVITTGTQRSGDQVATAIRATWDGDSRVGNGQVGNRCANGRSENLDLNTKVGQ
jgi:hypothetical protein